MKEKWICENYNNCEGCPHLKIIPMLTIDENKNEYEEEVKICEYNTKVKDMFGGD